MPLFILDASVLDGAGFFYAETTLIDRGRSVSLEWSNGADNSDLELFGYSIRYAEGDPEAQENV